MALKRFRNTIPIILFSQAVYLCETGLGKMLTAFFVGCCTASEVCQWLSSKLAIDHFKPASIDDLLKLNMTPGKNPKWYATTKAIAYRVCGVFEENEHMGIFNNVEWNLSGLIDIINNCIALWLFSSADEFKMYSLSALSRDWASAL